MDPRRWRRHLPLGQSFRVPPQTNDPSFHQGFGEPSRTLGPAFMLIAADLRNL